MNKLSDLLIDLLPLKNVRSHYDADGLNYELFAGHHSISFAVLDDWLRDAPLTNEVMLKFLLRLREEEFVWLYREVASNDSYNFVAGCIFSNVTQKPYDYIPTYVYQTASEGPYFLISMGPQMRVFSLKEGMAALEEKDMKPLDFEFMMRMKAREILPDGLMIFDEDERKSVYEFFENVGSVTQSHPANRIFPYSSGTTYTLYQQGYDRSAPPQGGWTLKTGSSSTF